MTVIDLIKVIFYGIVEGITEWLPVSSTGHLILFESIWPLPLSESFMSMFRVVIQLGAILAVVVTFWRKIWPFSPSLSRQERRDVWLRWRNIIIGCIPAAVLGFFLDDFLDAHLYRWQVIAAMLILYGVIFILVERWRRGKKAVLRSVPKMKPKTALGIGLFQALSLIPGTSRSGTSIIGGMLQGATRRVSIEFAFLMAVPIMIGASGYKLVKYTVREGMSFSGPEVISLIVGMAVAFAVSMLVIRFILGFVKKYSFAVFGYYRIALGIVIIIAALAVPSLMP